MEAFRIDTSLLNLHQEGEQRAKKLAVELSTHISALPGLAQPDIAYRYRQAAADAEKIYEFCRKMNEAIDEMELEAQLTAKNINSMLEESIYNIEGRIPDTEAALLRSMRD